MTFSLEENLELSDRDKTPLSFGVTVIVLCYTQIVLAIVSNVITLYAFRCKDISLDDITQLVIQSSYHHQPRHRSRLSVHVFICLSRLRHVVLST